jgi:outer membrane protein assembly factor BamB
MVDVSITVASVLAGANADIEHGTAGAVITAGQVVYKESATGLFKLADADGASVEVKTPYGIALNSAPAVGQPVAVAKSGDVTVGGTLTAGTPYYLSDTAGGIRTTPDTGDYVALLGLAKSASVLALRIQVPGVTL